jgi:hypothetical protein
MKTIYLYDNDGIFIKEDILSDDSNFPENLTTIKPSVIDGCWPIFVDGSWINTQYISGKLFYDTAKENIFILKNNNKLIDFSNPVDNDNIAFFSSVVDILGGAVLSDKFSINSPLFFAFILAKKWADFRLLLEDAKDKNSLTVEQYQLITESLVTFNI